MQRLKILFDVTQLVRGIIDSRDRSGIFFVAQNILKELSKRADVDVILLPMAIDSMDLFYLREKHFHSLKMFENPSSLDAAFYKIRKILKRTRTFFSRMPIIRKSLYVIIRFVDIFHTFVHKYDFSKYSSGDYVYFSPNQAPPKEIRKASIKSYIVLHDVIPLLLEEYKEQSQKGWFKKLIDSFGNQDTYFAVSKSTKKDFLSQFPILKSENLHIISLAASDNYKVEKNEAKLNSVKEKYGIPKEKKYIFSLCTLEPRKNQLRAISCFLQFVRKHHLDDIVVVLGGGAGTILAQTIKKDIEAAGEGAVLPIGYVDDEDLPVLYSYAEWFVFTSQYEGFGLPPLEAMQCGCPVITSNNSSLPEVVGDAGIMIDWDSDEQHVEAYEKYYFDENKRRENRLKGLERAKLFSWMTTTNGIVDVMHTEMVKNRETLNIVYRMCDSVNVSSSNKRCFNVPKNQLIKKCLTSLKSSLKNYLGSLRFYCVADNCSDDIVSFVHETFPDAQITRFEKIGNARSFCECVELVSSLPNGEQVLFLEDDYYFLNEDVLEKMNLCLRKLSAEKHQLAALMPDDYPDRYQENSINTECRITEMGHFLRIDKTTCTFATYTDVVKKYKKYFLRFSEWPKVSENESINEVWKKIPLYQPIPAWTLHCQTKDVIPMYLDYKKIKTYIEG